MNSNSKFLLQDKVALITGATSGIGHATAHALAQAGAKLVLGARRKAEGGQLAAEIQSQGGKAVFLPTDVTDPGQLQELVSLATKEFGGLDIAFNNAGSEGKGIVPFVEDDEENLRQLMELNFFALRNAMKLEVPAMVERGGGAIINNTSVAGLKGFGGFSSYVASKFAVEGLSRSVAHEVAAAGVRVNTIAPGPIETALLDRTTGGDHQMFAQFVPMGRAGRANEVASLVVFLASNAASYVNGQTLRVDGGMIG